MPGPADKRSVGKRAKKEGNLLFLLVLGLCGVMLFQNCTNITLVRKGTASSTGDSRADSTASWKPFTEYFPNCQKIHDNYMKMNAIAQVAQVGFGNPMMDLFSISAFNANPYRGALMMLPEMLLDPKTGNSSGMDLQVLRRFVGAAYEEEFYEAIPDRTTLYHWEITTNGYELAVWINSKLRYQGKISKDCLVFDHTEFDVGTGAVVMSSNLTGNPAAGLLMSFDGAGKRTDPTSGSYSTFTHHFDLNTMNGLTDIKIFNPSNQQTQTATWTFTPGSQPNCSNISWVAVPALGSFLGGNSGCY